MEHIAQGKRSDTLGIACWSSRALKGQKLYPFMLLFLLDN